LLDFLDSDWFIITLEIVFVTLLAYDIKKYIQTKKKEYITNIVLTLGFAIWTLYPMYLSYFGWEEEQKKEMISSCENDENQTLCRKVDDAIFKNYTYEEYKKTDINSTQFKEFIEETKEDILDDGWF